MKDKKRFVTVEDLETLQRDYSPQYVLLLSGRNDGKSYATKLKCLRDFWEKGEQFHFLKRFEIDLKREDQSGYWADFMETCDNKGRNVIQQITGGKWSAVISPRGGKTFNLANYTDEPGKWDIGPVCGRIHALSIARSYKSLQFPTCGNILFEEFVTDSGYLYNEPSKLLQYVSTVFRSRQGTVWLVGNTISRLNPYYKEWELVNALKMTPGQIDIYDHAYTGTDGIESKTRIVIYMPDVDGKVGGHSMFFGSSAGMIQGQKWDSKEQSHLESRRAEYDSLYTVVFESGAGLSFLLSLLKHKTEPDRVLWYVEPKTSEIQKGTRIIGAVPHEGSRWTSAFTPLTSREREAFRLLDFGRIAYSDNLTGTEFNRALALVKVRGSGTE